MILTPAQEEFMHKFFEGQREIGQQSLDNVTLLAKTNIEGILLNGVQSPPTIDKMEAILDELKVTKAKQQAIIAAFKEEMNDGEGKT